MPMYVAPQGFTTYAPRKGTKSATARPLVLIGAKGTIRKVSPSDAQVSAIAAEADPRKRAALIAALTNGVEPLAGDRVQITTFQRDALRASIAATVTDAAIAEALADEAFVAGLPGADTPEAETRRILAGRAFGAILASGVVHVVANPGSENVGAKGADKTAATIADLFADL